MIEWPCHSTLVAAEAIVKAFTNNDFSFKDHRLFVKQSRLGMTLSMLHLLAKLFYGPLHEKMVRHGLMDPKISNDFGDFLAGKIKPSASLVINIARRLATNVLF